MPLHTISPVLTTAPPRLKITDIKCHVLLAPDFDVTFTSSAQDSLVVVIYTDGGVSGVGVRRTFGILLVLELALDDLGLGATAGALNPLDVLVILVGCQDCLQLRVCDLKESGFIWVYTSTIAL